MNFKIMSLFLLASLTSCQVYKSDFDCPPGKGVPCTSVSDIQKMIIETPDGGPDIFSDILPSEFTTACSEGNCRKREILSNSKSMRKRIWVDEDKGKNTSIQGHFIYFDDSDGEKCCQ